MMKFGINNLELMGALYCNVASEAAEDTIKALEKLGYFARIVQKDKYVARIIVEVRAYREDDSFVLFPSGN